MAQDSICIGLIVQCLVMLVGKGDIVGGFCAAQLHVHNLSAECYLQDQVKHCIITRQLRVHA